MNQATSQDQAKKNPWVQPRTVENQEETHLHPGQADSLPQAGQGCLPQAHRRKAQVHRRQAEMIQQANPKVTVVGLTNLFEEIN